MTVITLSDILDDLGVAEQGLRKFERRYWLSSEDFYKLYSQGLLDNGENLEDFSEWAAYFKLRKKRQNALNEISSTRIKTIQEKFIGETIYLKPAEPVFQIG